MLKVVLLSLVVSLSLSLDALEQHQNNYKQELKEALKIGVESYTFFGVTGAGAYNAVQIGKNAVISGINADLFSNTLSGEKVILLGALGAALGTVVAVVDRKGLISREKNHGLSRKQAAVGSACLWALCAATGAAYAAGF